jgi:choline dehydrogenase-like flavoprotein
MATQTVAIVGSGIAGTTIAYYLTQRGYDVHIFEKGPEYPYPHSSQYQAHINLDRNHDKDLPSDLRRITISGDIPYNPEAELRMRVGGMATMWEGITLRMRPADFQTRTRYVRGVDWGITYDELESYYARAETYLGVSGTVDDNPFTPPRSTDYPLPPFELSYEDEWLADRLRKHDLHLHSTPQARTRQAFNGRAGCVNFGVCEVCPIGARYSPQHHLGLAMGTGHCTVETNVAVRAIMVDGEGRTAGLVVQDNDATTSREHAADVVIVAAGALETPRLLLLSKDTNHPDGVGNRSGHVGQHLGMHHLHVGQLFFDQPVYPGRVGFWTAQSEQFTDHADRGHAGGVKIELSANLPRSAPISHADPRAVDALMALAPDFLNSRLLITHAESDTTPSKYVTLSEAVDRFGDPFAHVHYESSEFDRETYHFSQGLFERFRDGTGARDGILPEFDQWNAGYHHLGTCRMGVNVGESVVNRYGQVHGIRNLFLAGASLFAGTAAVNPTLTIVALAMQTADYLLDQVLD